MIKFKELREQLTDESIKNILLEFNVEPVAEDEDKIIFPTCCHNLTGGSPKLYYYKSNKMFHCYTHCAATFDIFTLLQKMYKLRDKDITLYDAIQICNLDVDEVENLENDPDHIANNEDLVRLQSLNNIVLPNLDNDELTFRKYDKKVLRHFSFDYDGLMPWIKEGMTVDALQRFNIKYDVVQNAIIIPNYDYYGNLIGIRARYFNPEDIKKGKYRPVYIDNTLYSHPTGRTFYGIFENHRNIEKRHICIIFEGEKSTILYGSIYGNDQNIALSTLGQNITRDHIQYLLKMGVRDVILAYDADYEDQKQFNEIEEKYRAKAHILEPYFNVSYLMDDDGDLNYKDSPIDKGKEIFEKLLQQRRIL